MEIEVPAQDPRTFSNITRHGQSLLKLETVLMTVYYPAAIGSGSGPAPSGDKNWSRETWLPRPRVRHAGGYGKFAGVGGLAVPFFGATSMFTKLPAYRNAPLAMHWPPLEKDNQAGHTNKNETGEAPEGESKEPKFPLMIFSHGLGGSRTMYSSVCGEFASYGFVCVALEHRDGSGARTFVNHPPEGDGSIDDIDGKTAMDHKSKQKRNGYDVIDYVFPKDNRRDTTPANDKGVDQELRSAQIDLRCAEIEEAYQVICEIVGGDGEDVERRNLRQKGFVGSSSRGLKGIRWDTWKGRVHLDQVTALGHSFGAATTIEIIRSPKRFHWVSQGIIFDIWAAGMKAAESSPSNHIAMPLLAINSEAFSYWESNYKLVHELVKEAQDSNALAWLLTFRGTIHISYSDFALLYPRISSLLLKMTADPQRALDININACLEFLKIVMPDRLSQINRVMQSEGILNTKVTADFEDFPDEELHKPKKLWMAARLKIPHEFRYRFDPKMAIERRKAKKDKKRNAGLIGYGDPTEEVWMHVAPSQEQLRKHGVPNEKETQTQGTNNDDLTEDSSNASRNQEKESGEMLSRDEANTDRESRNQDQRQQDNDGLSKTKSNHNHGSRGLSNLARGACQP